MYVCTYVYMQINPNRPLSLTPRTNLPTYLPKAVKGSDCVVFLDWEDGALIRRIDVLPKDIYWNETGEIVLLACDESYFVLKYNKVGR